MFFSQSDSVTRFFYTQIQHLSQNNCESEHHKTKKMRCDNVINFLFQLDEEAGAERKYVMRKGWKLHLYISQLPCIFSNFHELHIDSLLESLVY